MQIFLAKTLIKGNQYKISEMTTNFVGQIEATTMDITPYIIRDLTGMTHYVEAIPDPMTGQWKMQPSHEEFRTFLIQAR